MKNLFRLTFLFSMGALMSCQNQAKENPAGKVIVIAHRGSSHYAPENTVAAAELAWEQGADAVEIDLRLSSDGQIVIMHDKNTERTAGKNYVISETPWDTLRTLEVGSFKAEKYKGEPIPLLGDIVQAIPEGKSLFFDIKVDKKIVPIIKEKFGDHPKADQFVFIPSDYETAKAVKKAFPDNEVYWLSGEFEEDTRTVLQRVKEDGLDGVDLNYSIITPEMIAIAEELGLTVYAYTVDDPEKVAELQRMGVKGITTNKPVQVLAVLAGDDQSKVKEKDL